MKRMVMAALAGSLLAGCSLPKMDPAAEALAKKAYVQLGQGDLKGLIAETSPADFGPNPGPVLQRLQAILPKGEPGPPKLVGFNSYAGTGGTTLTLNYRYDYVDASVTASTMLGKDAKAAGGWVIRGLHVELGPPPEGAVNAPAQPSAPVLPGPQRPAPKPPTA